MERATGLEPATISTGNDNNSMVKDCQGAI